MKIGLCAERLVCSATVSGEGYAGSLGLPVGSGLAHRPVAMFLASWGSRGKRRGGDFAPGEYLAITGDILVVTTGEWGAAADIWSTEDRDAGK